MGSRGGGWGRVETKRKAGEAATRDPDAGGFTITMDRVRARALAGRVFQSTFAHKGGRFMY